MSLAGSAIPAVRAAMVREQIAARGVRDPRVLAAMAAVPRESFVPASMRSQAHGDHPLPLGPGQSISQPYIVAFMAEALDLRGHERVLEIGSGCGYFAAVLGMLAAEVCGIERDPVLAAASARTLQALGCANVRIRAGDGALGWPERAPFDAIVLSCAADALPAELWNQLAGDGLALLPEIRAGGGQVLARHRPNGAPREALLPVAFVPLVCGS